MTGSGFPKYGEVAAWGLWECAKYSTCARLRRIAGLHREGRMEELRHQLGRCRLMRVVTGQAIRRAEGLILMRLLQPSVLHVVAVQTKRRNRLGQMESIVEGQLC